MAGVQPRVPSPNGPLDLPMGGGNRWNDNSNPGTGTWFVENQPQPADSGWPAQYRDQRNGTPPPTQWARGWQRRFTTSPPLEPPTPVPEPLHPLLRDVPAGGGYFDVIWGPDKPLVPTRIQKERDKQRLGYVLQTQPAPAPVPLQADAPLIAPTHNPWHPPPSLAATPLTEGAARGDKEAARRRHFLTPFWQPVDDSASSRELQVIEGRVRQCVIDDIATITTAQERVFRMFVRRATRAHFTTRDTPGVKLAAFMDLGSQVDLITEKALARLNIKAQQAEVPLRIQGWNPSDSSWTSTREAVVTLIPNTSDKRFTLRAYPVRFRVVPTLYGTEDLVLSDVTMLRMGLLAGARIVDMPPDPLEHYVIEGQREDPYTRGTRIAHVRVARGGSPTHPDSDRPLGPTDGGSRLQAELDDHLVHRSAHQHEREPDPTVLAQPIVLGPTILTPDECRAHSASALLSPLGERLTEAQRATLQRKLDDLTQSDFADLLGPIPAEPSQKLKDNPCRFKVDPSKLVPQPHRAHSDDKKRFLEETVQTWRENNYVRVDMTIRPIMQMTVQKKPNGRGFRVCLDGRSLNDAITTDTAADFPLPDIRQAVRQAARARIRSTVDLREAFFQTVVADECLPYLTASTGRGGVNFQFKRLFFGLNIATAYFQWLMTEKVFKDCIDEGYVIVYVDDVVIYSDTPEQHLRHVRRVLEIMREWGLRFAADKCKWACHEMKFLGREIAGDVIRVPQDYINELLTTEPPQTVKQLRSLLGKLNWIRGFLPDVGRDLHWLQFKLQQRVEVAFAVWASSRPGVTPCARWVARQPIDWFITPEEEQRFCQRWAQYKATISRPLELYPLDPSRLTFLETDACDQGMGAVLYQTDKVVMLPDESGNLQQVAVSRHAPMGRRYLCGVWSQPFTATQQRWSTGDQELYASLAAMLHWREWLSAHQFTCLTDHRNTLFSAHKDLSDSSIRVQRAVYRLQEFPVTFVHIKGEDNVAADYLSRRFPKEVSPTFLQLERAHVRRVLQGLPSRSDYAAYHPTPHVRDSLSRTWDDWNSDQFEDEFNPLWVWDGDEPLHDDHDLRSGDHTTPTPGNEGIEHLVRSRAIHSHDHQTYGRARMTRTMDLSPVQTEGLISLFHNPIAGHGGVERTVQAMQSRHFRWPGMRADVKRYIEHCPFCQRNNPRVQGRTLGHPQGGMLPQAQQPRDIVAIDTIGPLWQSDESEPRYVLAFIDAFSRHCHLEPITTLTAVDAATAVLRYIGDFGFPKHLYSDQGPQFDNLLMKHLAVYMGVKWTHSVPSVHQSNGHVERLNGETGRHLRALIHSVPREARRLVIMLPLIQRICNGTYHSAIGMTPAALMFGSTYQPDRFITPAVIAPDEDPSSAQEHEEDLGPGSLDLGVPLALDPRTQSPYVEWLNSLDRDLRTLIEASLRHQRLQLRARHGVDDRSELTLGEPIAQGTWVWAHTPKERMVNAALRYPWQGPYKVYTDCPANESRVHLTNPRGRDPDRVFTQTRANLKLAFTSRLDELLTCMVPTVDMWEVQKVVGHETNGKGRRKRIFLRIRWEGFGPEDDSMLLPSKVPDNLVRAYLAESGVASVTDLNHAYIPHGLPPAHWQFE